MVTHAGEGARCIAPPVRAGVRTRRTVDLQMQAEEVVVKEGKKATAPVTAQELVLEIARRRTFAIIANATIAVVEKVMAMPMSLRSSCKLNPERSR